MKGWRDSIRAAVAVCGLTRSAGALLLMVALHFSAPRRRWRPLVAKWLLQLLGAPDPIRVRLRRPRCSVWLRPFDGGDIQSFLEVFVRRIYPVPRGGTVVDAGANVGLFSVFALTEGNPDLVVAIEPDSANVEVLRRNVGVHSDRVRVVASALWSKEGRARFVRAGKSNIGHLEEARGVDTVAAEETLVTTVTPDSSVLPPPEEIDFMKLDIEGAELAVLDVYLRRLRPNSALVAELHGAEAITRFRSRLGNRWEVLDDQAPTALVFSWTARTET